MKNLIIALIAIFSFTLVNAQDIKVKESIVTSFENFEGNVSQSSIDTLISDLSNISTDSTMCFYSLDNYNNCNEYSDAIYASVVTYLDDLIGKDVTVKLTKWNKPWDDENFYTLKFEIYYTNDNVNFPVDTNFDTFIVDISNDKIVNIILAREWIDLAYYGK